MKLLVLASALLFEALLSADEERLRSAKSLVFDRKYAEARAAWQEVLASSSGEEAAVAAYWVARCSENLKEPGRALEEYAAFLERRPADRSLVEQARSSRVALAGRLYRSGQKQHLPVLQGGLVDPNRNVRALAAFELADLGPPVAAEAVPVLKRIAAQETDPELRDRAKVLLLRLDPQALAQAAAPDAGPRTVGPRKPGGVTFLRVRVFSKGVEKPTVALNLPLSLAEFAYKSLPEDTKKELRARGYDADNFWERLKKLGPTEIVTVVREDGEKIQIWIE